MSSGEWHLLLDIHMKRFCSNVKILIGTKGTIFRLRKYLSFHIMTEPTEMEEVV